MVKYVLNLHGQYDSYKLGPKVRTVYLVRVGCEHKIALKVDNVELSTLSTLSTFKAILCKSILQPKFTEATMFLYKYLTQILN